MCALARYDSGFLAASGFAHQLVGIQDQGNGAVVDGRNLHVGTELAVLGRIAQLLADGKELFITFFFPNCKMLIALFQL